MGARRDAVCERQCGQKVRHATRKAAVKASQALLVDTGSHCHAYHCRFCHAWHIGHNRPVVGVPRAHGLNFDWRNVKQAA